MSPLAAHLLCCRNLHRGVRCAEDEVESDAPADGAAGGSDEENEDGESKAVGSGEEEISSSSSSEVAPRDAKSLRKQHKIHVQGQQPRLTVSPFLFTIF